MAKEIQWHEVLPDLALLPEGRVMTAIANGHREICLTHYQGKICALDNRCPHQGGPLGEGSIEKGLLRCPWHGWDYDPCTGKAPGYDDGVTTYPVEIRDGAVYVGLEPEVEHRTTVSELMVQTMLNWGVDTVFGMVGHSNLGLADAFRRQAEQGKLTYIGIRHEGGGAFAASAYGKLTGRPAACFAIAGPGSTNMYTGMWDARQDRAPLLALTGQVATQVLGTGNFQEVDLVQAFSSVATFNHRVQRDSKHAELMSRAIKQAVLRREVSHLTFPDEIQTIPVQDGEKAQGPEGRITPQTISPPAEMLDKAIGMIRQAQRPVIITGHGARFHMDGIVALAEQLNCPVLTTFKGKGQISDGHPLGCGVLGRSGTPIASHFMNEADLLLVFGASFSNHTGITPKKPTIQVDFDPMALSKFHPIDAAVWGEISVTCRLMREALAKGPVQATDQGYEIAERWRIWKAEKASRLRDHSEKGLSSISVFDALTRLAPENAVMCVDVGNNAYSFGRYFEPRAHTFLMSGYLGSIGFAMPAALGAWAAVRDKRPVIAVAGDGGFAQYMAELTTSVQYGMNIKVILLNNSELAKISKEQRSGQFEVFATGLSNPHFADYASSCGALGVRVTRQAELEEAMNRVLAHPGTALLEVCTDPALI